MPSPVVGAVNNGGRGASNVSFSVNILSVLLYLLVLFSVLNITTN